MNQLAIELESALIQYSENSKMTKHLVKSLLGIQPRPSNQLCYKFIALKWFTSKGCRFIVNEGEETSSIPTNWIEVQEFGMIYNGFLFTVEIHMNSRNISVVCIYYGRRDISQVVVTRFENVPQITETLSVNENSDEKDEVIGKYNEIVFSFETEFYRKILHYFHVNEEPRSTALTPNSVHSRR